VDIESTAGGRIDEFPCRAGSFGELNTKGSHQGAKFRPGEVSGLRCDTLQQLFVSGHLWMISKT
jgi:hypothetical protein